MWAITFSTADRTENGRSKSIWLLSLGLASRSTPACVDADLLVSRHPQMGNHTDTHEPEFVVLLGSDGRELQPGSKNAITGRLDNGPMGPHLQNEFVKTSSVCLFYQH
jgi:hypothetical protein